MGLEKRSRDSSYRENWDRIFKTFVEAIREKEEQLESLVKNKKILEDRIKTQHDQWVSDIQNYKNQLSLMKNEAETLEMMRLVDTAKRNLLLALKETDLSLCKLKLEHTHDDFRAWFDILTQNENKEICNSGDADDDCKSVEIKIRKLKHDFEKLAFGKSCKLSTLLRETGFAWSQFKRIEGGFTDKLMRKDEEIKRLRSYNHEKDKIISRLMANVAESEGNGAGKKKDGEISRLPPHEVKPPRRSPRLSNNGNSVEDGEISRLPHELKPLRRSPRLNPRSNSNCVD